MRKTIISLLCSIFAVLSTISVWPQSGGTFVIEKSVIAGGGGQTVGGAFTLDGTIGETVGGTTSTGGTFALGGGFWGGGRQPRQTRRYQDVS